MKRAWKAILAVVMAAVLAFGLAACNDPNTPGGGNVDIDAVKGDYGIYVSDMNMSVYLRITEDGKFKFSAEEEFTSDKAQGTVGKPDTSYLMMYTSVDGAAVTAGSTPNTHFTKESDGRLKFTDRITYGSSGIAASEDAPIYAIPIADYEEPQVIPVESDVYVTEVNFMVNGTEVMTDLYLTLEEDSFTLFAMYMPETDLATGFTFLQSGAASSVMGMTALSIEGNDNYGSVQGGENGTIKLTVEEDAFTTEGAEMGKADVSKPIMAFTGEAPTGMGSYNYTLTLDVYANGSYAYESAFVMGPMNFVYTENGTYKVDFAAATDNVTLISSAGTSVTASVDYTNNTFSGQMIVSEPEEGAEAERVDVSMNLSADIFVGSYLVDLSGMGMPLSYDLIITDSDGIKFEIYKAGTDTAACTGSVIASLTGGALVYETPADKENSPFVMENGALRFTDNLTVSAMMTLPSPVVDEDAGTETWLVATPVTLEVENGAYSAIVSHESQNQSVFLTVADGIFYYFADGFETGNFESVKGTVADQDGVKTLTDGENNVFGTVTATGDGIISAEIKVFGEPKELEMVKADVSGDPLTLTTTVEKAVMGPSLTEFTVTLSLYQNGAYEYKTTFAMGAMGEMTGYEESGFYAVQISADSNTIAFFTVAEGAYAGTKSGAFGITSLPITITAEFFIVDGDTAPTEITVSFGGNGSAEETPQG